MTIRRTTGSRRTTVHCADSRVAGHYESSMEWPSPDGNYAGVAAALGPSVWIACRGRLGIERLLTFSALVGAAQHLPGGMFGVPIVDLLAVTRLDRTAEVVVFTDRQGDRLAVPVRDLTSGGALILGTTTRPIAASTDLPFLLDIPGWTDDEVHIAPVSMRAVSFSEFVQCQ